MTTIAITIEPLPGGRHRLIQADGETMDLSRPQLLALIQHENLWVITPDELAQQRAVDAPGREFD